MRGRDRERERGRERKRGREREREKEIEGERERERGEKESEGRTEKGEPLSIPSVHIKADLMHLSLPLPLPAWLHEPSHPCMHARAALWKRP